MLEIINFPQKREKSYNDIVDYYSKPRTEVMAIRYFSKVFKSPMFYLLLIGTVFLTKSLQMVDPLSTPYPPAQVNFRTSQKYLSSNYAASSRLGNHLFELASIVSIARNLHRIPIFFIEDCYHEKMWEDTNRLIPGLVNQFLVINGSVPSSIPSTFFHMKCCTFDDPNNLVSVEDEYLHLQGTHYQSWRYFSEMRDELMDYLKEPDNSFSELPKSSPTTHVTCVHIRRGDFLNVGFHVADRHFIQSAMRFVRHREGRRKSYMTTVFFGDDPIFMDSLVNDTITSNESFTAYVSQNSPADDILYSKSNCDVVLITAAHSTFGWWIGYMSKGNRVYYTDIQHTNDWILQTGEFVSNDYYPSHWTPLKYSSPENLTVVESIH